MNSRVGFQASKLHPKILIFIFLISCFSGSFSTPLWPFTSKVPKPIRQPAPKIREYPIVPNVSRDPDDVRFYLFANPEDKFDYDELVFENLETLKTSRYNPKLPLVILTHGFTQNFFGDFPTVIKDAYLDSGFHKLQNIVAVDWGKLSGPRVDSSGKLVYLDVFTRSIPIVKTRIAKFLQYLISAGVLKGAEDIHMIGQSMGAHTSGFAAREFYSDTNTKIRRLTGTDPAGPIFSLSYYYFKMSKTDATFVDVYHTDAGGLGIDAKVGHVDFTINGGVRVQPGCETLDENCSHNMAPHFYATSIRDPTLFGCLKSAAVDNVNGTLSCEEQYRAPFGENCPAWAHGTYLINLKEH